MKRTPAIQVLVTFTKKKAEQDATTVPLRTVFDAVGTALVVVLGSRDFSLQVSRPKLKTKGRKK